MRKVFVAFIILSISSCVPLQEDSPVSKGDAICFKAVSTNAAEETKTVYSGQKDYGTTTKYERVNWVAGDRIRISSAQCPAPYYADYEVSEVSGVTDQYSSAQVSPTDPSGHGLTWGDGPHDFYAIYPAPDAPGAPTEMVYTTGTSATLAIPATQVFSSIVESGSLIKKLPDMNYAYMYAATRVTNPAANVSLAFKPLFTAFEITVGSDGSDFLDLYSFYMTANQNLSGTYTVTMNAETGAWTLGTVTSGSNRIDVDLGGISNPTQVKNDKALTFTVFAIPQPTIDGIVLHFETSKGPRTLELKYSDDSWIEVNAGQKAFIEGLQIPGTVRVYTIEPISDLISWGVGAFSDAINVRSYSKNVISNVQRDERWKIEYSSNYNESTGTGDWYNTTTAAGASWLTVSGATLFDGSEETLTVKMQERSGGTHVTGEIQDIRTAILKATPAVPANYDLSMHTIHGDTRSLPVTANCYVVKAPGTYYFPIVYGNAIDGTKSDAQNLTGVGNVINKEAYWPSDANIPADALYFLKRFFNADNMPITSPFVLDDLLTNGSITDSTPLDAIALWQDGSTTPFMAADAPTIVDGPTSSPLYGKCKFISFTIDPDNMRQGNIVIALRDCTNGSTAATAKIIWSWMIWVTDEDLHAQEVEMLSGSVKLMPYNVGWSDIQGTVERYDYDSRQCYVKITQIDGEASLIFKAQQSEGIGFTFYSAGASISGYGTAKAYLGSSPYYQYGRKDPFLGRDYTSGSTAKNIQFVAALDYAIAGTNDYMVNYNHSISTASGNLDLSLAIKNPYIFYHSDNDHTYFWFGGHVINPDWVKGFDSPYGIHNLWNAFSAGRGDDTKVRKTVYDPCPPDFCLPRRNAFSAFTRNGASTATLAYINGTFDSKRNGWSFNKKRMNGNTKDDSAGTIFFCKTGLRREGSINGTFKTWGAYWTAERKINGTYEIAEHLVLHDGNTVEPFYFNNAGGYLADSWSIRPALEEPW